MTWKKVINADAGTADKFGGNDLDKIADAFNGVDVSDPINYNVDINALKASTNALGDILKSNGTKYIRLPKGTANQVLAVNSGGTDIAWTTLAAGSGDITAGANVGTGDGQVFKDKTSSTLNFKRLAAGSNVTITNGTNDVTIASTAGGGGAGDITGASNVGTGTGQVFRDETTGVLNFKTLLAGSNVTLTNNANDVTIAASSAGGGWPVQPYTYFIYKDPADSLYKARKGTTGTHLATTSATNVTAVLDAVVADISPPTTPAVIEFASGDFPMTTVFNNITVPVIGNLTIRGQGMGATNLVAMSAITSGTVFEIFGSTSGSSVNLSANAVAGAATITVTSAASFAAGDTILLRSNAAFSTAASAQGKKGELHKIISIASNVITVDKWLHDTYNTADTASIIKIATLDNVTFSDLTMKADAAYTGTGNFVSFLFCDNLRVARLQVVNSRGTSINFQSCINFTADVVVEQTPTATFIFQYGVTVTCAAENGRIHVTGLGRFRHLVTTDASGSTNREGQVRNIEFSGEGETCDEATWDTHATAEGIAFRGCNVYGTRADTAKDAKGFQSRSKRTSITGCNVFEGVGKGITLGEDSSGSIVNGCNIVGTRELDNATLGYGIEVRGSVNNCNITGNQIINSKREGILIRTASGGHVITGNMIQGSGAEGIDGTDITNTVVSGNRITSNSKAINMTGTSDGWVITGNAMVGNGAANTIIGATTVNANNTNTP